MAFGKVAKTAVRRNPFSLVGILFYIKYIFIIIWIGSVAFAIYGAYQDGGTPEIVNYLGTEIANPMFQLNEISLQIIEQGGLTVEGQGFFEKIASVSGIYWNFFFLFIDIFFWLILIKYFVIAVFTGDTARVTSNWLITITLFFLIQIIFIAYFHDVGIEGITIPYEAIKNIIKAGPYLYPF